MLKDLMEKIRNKRIQRLVKKTHLWQTTQIEFLIQSAKQHKGSINSLRFWLDEIEKDS